MHLNETISGFSKSAWKSLAVKSLRIGWPTGLARAQGALGKSEMKMLLTCGVFEDVFPAESELSAVMDEIKGLDHVALCKRQTHHGRGLTPEFCRLESRAVAAALTERGRLWAKGKELGIWLPLRALNCWWTWLEMAPSDAGQHRTIDNAPWLGMPADMIDAHTLEGKRTGKDVTLLSGHYSQHLKLSQLVELVGWESVRREVHEKAPITANAQGQVQGELFGA